MQIGISIVGESEQMIFTVPESFALPVTGDYWNLSGDPTSQVMVSGYFRVVKRQLEMHGKADDGVRITSYGWTFTLERL